MEYAIVTLKKGEGRALKAGGAWIYDNEIESVMGHFEDGDLVLVRDFDGYGLGKGFINRHSKIRIRMMTRNPEQEIDREFIYNRVKAAWEYRKKTVDTSSCRVISARRTGFRVWWWTSFPMCWWYRRWRWELTG